ncbi:ATP-dependent DNA helicase [Trichonephila clavipes]|uniref:ATP-dependent DNA helicase n=1 Tax=Trichonephila clavipes TaxID=2585209 RepID=A0A8X6S2T3_TRICX|nr:ATP-dependent DNA helicase [Trichonephila clavipes]
MWIENHPSFETEEGIRLLDQVVSCQLPPDNTDLYELIIDQTSDEYLRNGGRICTLKQHLEDRWVNNYNPTLLKVWNGNIDLQLCGSIAYYVAKYISKSEPTELDSNLAQPVRQIQREESDTSQKLFKPYYIKKTNNVSNDESVDDYQSQEETTRRRLITLTNNTKLIVRNIPATLENAFNQVHAFRILDEENLRSNDEPIDEIEAPKQCMADDEFSTSCRAMNADQAEAFGFVT